MARSAVESCTCTSFSASAKVAGETSGPTAGPVPKAGGAPGGSCVGSWAISLAGSCAFERTATAAPRRPSEVWVRKCLRDLDMNPPGSIVAESHRARELRINCGTPKGSLLVGEGDVRAEADHSEAGSNALAAAKAHAALEFALERSGEDNHKKIGGGIEEYRESAENQELQKNMAPFRGDELRNEGEEKQSRLWVENFGKNPLPKRAMRGLQCADSHFRISRADHANAKPNQIRSAGKLDGVKCHGRSGKERGHAERGGQNMEESTNKGAEGRMDAFTAATGEAARQNVKNSRPWGDGQNQGSGKEKQETVCVEHPGIVRGRFPACK